MIYGYIRVSTDHQTTENQRFEIKQFCEKQNIIIEAWIEETVSATKALEKRKLGQLLKRIKRDDMIIASELSRLGRNLLQIMSILHHCMNVGAQVWTIKDNYRLGSDITSKVLAFAFGLSAEIERNLISQRTKEALARIKAEGRHLGRPVGQKINCKLEKHKDYIANRLKRGATITSIARKLNTTEDTVRSFMADNNLKRRYCKSKRDVTESEGD